LPVGIGTTPLPASAFDYTGHAVPFGPFAPFAFQLNRDTGTSTGTAAQRSSIAKGATFSLEFEIATNHGSIPVQIGDSTRLAFTNSNLYFEFGDVASSVTTNLSATACALQPWKNAGWHKVWIDFKPALSKIEIRFAPAAQNRPASANCTYTGVQLSTFVTTPETNIVFSAWAVANWGQHVVQNVKIGGTNPTPVSAFSQRAGSWTAQTAAGAFPAVKPIAQTLNDPVDSATGHFISAVTDISTPGVGVSFEFGRFYDSARRAQSWSFSYGDGISVNAVTGDATWITAQGAQLVFKKSGTNFITPPGVIASLSAVVGGGWQLQNQQTLETQTFGATGKLLSRKDRNGQGLTFAYTGNLLTTVTDAAGRVNTLTYYPANTPLVFHVSKVTTSDGRSVSYGFSQIVGTTYIALDTVTDERGKITRYTNDLFGRVTKVTTPDGKIEIENVYVASVATPYNGVTDDRVASQKDGFGNITMFAWDDVYQQVTMTDPTGAKSIHRYDGGLLETISTPVGDANLTYNSAFDITAFTDAQGNQWSATYDAVGNMLSRTSPPVPPATVGNTETWTYDANSNVKTRTDNAGATTTYTYDVTNKLLTQVAAPDSGVTKYTYYPNGLVWTVTDPLSGVTTNTYFPNGDLQSITDQTGGKTTYTYDTAGRVLTTTEPRGNVAGAVAANYTTTLTYDAAGHVLTSKGPSGLVTTNTYNDAGRLATVTAPDLGVTTYTYNAANEVETIKAPDGGIRTFAYDTRGAKTGDTNPLGQTTTYTYDPAGRMVTIVTPNAIGPTAAAYKTSYEYDAIGQKIKMTDAEGKITTYSYDPLGRLETSTDPTGYTTYTYDPNGNRSSETRRALINTVWTVVLQTFSEYDSMNRLKSTTDARQALVPPAAAKKTLYTYDLAGNLTSTTTPMGFTTKYTYDLASRKKSMIEPNGNVPGGVPAGYTTNYAYDIAGNLSVVTNPLGQTTTNTYSVTGKLETVKDARNNVTTYTFDTMDRVRGIAAPARGTTYYLYNTAGRLEQRVDQYGRRTYYEYDLLGRLKKETDPLGRVTTKSYVLGDATGTAETNTDAIANAAANPLLGTITRSRDMLGRLAKVAYSDTTPAVTTAYDPATGRKASMTDGLGTETYTYDSLSRLSQVTRTGTISETYAYVTDPNGNVTKRTMPDGTIIDSVFDDDNRLTSQTTTWPASFFNIVANGVVTAGWAFKTGTVVVTPTAGQLTFTPVGGILNVTGPTTPPLPYAVVQISAPALAGATITATTGQSLGTVSRSTTLDATGKGVIDLPRGGYDFRLGGLGTAQVSISTVMLSSELPAKTTFEYNANGQRTKTTFPNKDVRLITYDKAGRIAQIDRSIHDNMPWRYAYVRDANGNPTQITTTYGTGVGSTIAKTMVYDVGNQVTSVSSVCSSTQPACPTAKTFTYDLVGDRIGANGVTYTFDGGYQLLSASGTPATSFTFDKNGNQLTKGTALTDTYTYNVANQVATQGGIAQKYSYDGNGNLRRVQLGGGTNFEILSWDINNPLPMLWSDSQFGQSRYTYADGELIATKNAEGPSSFLSAAADHVGTIPKVTFNSGFSGDFYNGDAGVFGEQNPWDSLSIGFTGQQKDPGGNFRMRARQYQPSLASFTQKDPMPTGPGTPYESPYVYVGNNPTVYTDPSGLTRCAAGCSSGAAKNSIAQTQNQNPFAMLLPDKMKLRATCGGGAIADGYGGDVQACHFDNWQVTAGPSKGTYYGSTFSVGVGVGAEVSAGFGELWTDVKYPKDMAGGSVCASVSLGPGSGQYCYWSGGQSLFASVGVGTQATAFLKLATSKKGFGGHLFGVKTWVRAAIISIEAPSWCDMNRSDPSCVAKNRF
jgi:RHS repeat-associated protein